MGLDLSYTRTGVCVWDGVQAQIATASSDVRKPYIERAQGIREDLVVLVERYRPHVFCIESPLSHAHRAEILTGLYFLVLDRLHQCMRGFSQIEGIVVLPNPSLRRLMGVKQGRGSKSQITKTEFKKKIVSMASSLAGPQAPMFTHDEADAFHLAYYTWRFWRDWKGSESLDPALTGVERDVWYSEEKVAPRKKKSPTKKVKSKIKESPFKRKGVVYRHGEFLFLPGKGSQ